MNIILLSGGSGKRLWPLSNETRSKQFLKLLQAPDGSQESMVQRVYRQIHEAGIIAPVLVATSSSQEDSIRSNLGSDVDIILEPERRNTFPAIALSTAYLKYKKQHSDNEVVIVLPVDPYAELGYFKTLLRMEEAVINNSADLVLMGIAPTYPSEKYGYIVPENKQFSEPKKVSRFTEKPTQNEAEQLIADGAVWNSGVFAFRLGWLMEIIELHIHAESYEDLYNRYRELKNDSFDYEVAEKTHSISMVSYEGVWKDLGTWNTLTEEMNVSSIGNVILGEDATNTHVINELDIPVVVLGTSDLIVAASPDGIIVSDKIKSANLKKYVNNIDQRPMYEERRWGEYHVIHYDKFSEKKALTKHLFIKAGAYISYHIHKHRDEIWTFVDGTGNLVVNGHTRNVHVGDIAYIERGQKHSIRAVTDLRIIEVQLGDILSESDIDRYEWIWD